MTLLRRILVMACDELPATVAPDEYVGEAAMPGERLPFLVRAGEGNVRGHYRNISVELDASVVKLEGCAGFVAIFFAGQIFLLGDHASVGLREYEFVGFHASEENIVASEICVSDLLLEFDQVPLYLVARSLRCQRSFVRGSPPEQIRVQA